LENNKDRRYIDRIPIPGSKVYHRKSAFFLGFKRYKGPSNLSDITKSTISIPERLSYDKKISLDVKIIFPQNISVNMKGFISTIEEDPSLGKIKTIVQFYPYGYGKKYNNFRTKKKLARILSHFSQNSKA